MASPVPSREALQNLWRARVQEAQRRYLIAKTLCADAAPDATDASVPVSDGHFAFRRALAVEAAG